MYKHCPVLTEQEWDWQHATYMHRDLGVEVVRIRKRSGDNSDKTFIMKQVSVRSSYIYDCLEREFLTLTASALKAVPNIVPLYGVFRRRSPVNPLFWTYCFVFAEECGFEPLYKYCCADTVPGQELQLDEIQTIIQQLVHTVSLLHQHLGKIHGDIKPDNILYCRNTRQIRLIDFGASFAFDQVQLPQLSTLEYRPYEAALNMFWLFESPNNNNNNKDNIKLLSSKLDVWSIGITVLEMMLHRVPDCMILAHHLDRLQQHLSLDTYLAAYGETAVNRWLLPELSLLSEHDNPTQFSGDNSSNDELPQTCLKQFLRDCLQFLPTDRLAVHQLREKYSFLCIPTQSSSSSLEQQ
jgi:serine/threonine protein kinase